MNYLEATLKFWFHAPLAKELGWSLIHFLWEGVLVALLLASLLYLCRGASSHLRYGLSCVALLAMPVSLAITLATATPERPAPKSMVPVTLIAPAAESSDGPALPSPRLSLKAVLPWVPLFWITGVLVFYVRTMGGWMVTRRLQRAGVSAAPVAWQEHLDAWCRRLRLSQKVTLLESCLVDVPVIMGFLRPVILVPVGLLAGLPASQVECILIHELAHVRRWDYVVNLLQNLVEGLLFYHPAVWWVSEQVRAERENCCDDMVVKLKGDARGYAAALANLEQNRWPAQQPALAANGGNLMKRIRRLLHEPERRHTPAAPVLVAGLLLVSVGVAVASWEAQAVPAPKPAAPSSRLLMAPPVVTPESAPAPAVRRPATLIAQVAARAQAQDPKTLIDKQKARAEKLQNEPQTPYRKWLNEDVAYIISDEERSAFKKLATEDEQEQFIEQFWLRRDPTPGTVENEFRDEHYRRIAYANEHFATGISGWKTDRGRVYIVYGPPDEIESHPSGGAYQRPAEEGGGTVTTVAFEQWRYRWIEGVGTNVIIEFAGPEYRMTSDPNEKVAATPSDTKIGATARVIGDTAEGTKAVLISVPIAPHGDHAVAVIGEIRSASGRPVSNFQKGFTAPSNLFTQIVPLAPGSYTLKLLVRDTTTGEATTEVLAVEVK
ncbi:MAG TPA: GWxTD domain-containing protein [Bryobacteraceae bacterium]|nr:GWxTD domain-containing protein [Bryobacteraceae bacterium]